MLDSDLGDIFDQEKPKKVTGTIFTQTSVIIHTASYKFYFLVNNINQIIIIKNGINKHVE